MPVITARHEELKQQGHAHIESLKKHFPEYKIRRHLSRVMGMKWNDRDADSGFHFSHAPSLRQMEEAVKWLALADAQKKLRVSFKEPKEEKVLPYQEMRTALARLPKRRKLPFWKRWLLRLI